MDFQIYDIALVPVLVAVVQLVKSLGVPARFLPLASIALGIIAGFVYLSPNDPAKAVLMGLVMGLSAVGLFSGYKNTRQP